MMNPDTQGSALSGWRVGLVSAYLLAVYCWLRLRGRLPSTGLRRWAMARLRKPRSVDLRAFVPEAGHCFVAPAGGATPSDQEAVSLFILFEDGTPLPHPHSTHDDIRAHGGGRYSHWGRRVYFATSDNSDPRTNGRSYRLIEVRR